MWALLLWLGSASAADVNSRFSTGLLVETSASTGKSEAEWLVGETLAVGLSRDGSNAVELVAGARAGIRLVDASLDRMRVRALGLRMRRDGWKVDVGRFAPQGGGYRLVDGVQILAPVGTGGVSVGGWLGLGANPWNTSPMARFGGGPVLMWEGAHAEGTLLGEVLVTPDGLDRVSGVATARIEISDEAEFAALLDVQSVPGGVGLADATVRARLDPHEEVRVDLVYDAWSSISYLVSAARDPTIRRWSLWSQAATGDIWIPQDQLDPTVYHQPRATVTWRKRLGGQGVALNLSAYGRQRMHRLPSRWRTNAGVNGRLTGLVGGRLELGLGQGVLHFQGHTGHQTTALLWLQLDGTGRLALDCTAEGIVQPIVASEIWGPSVYADAFLDASVSKALTLSAGYAFSNSQDLERWDAWHAGMLRIGWRVDTRSRE